uniref:Fe2OG dioxygenase domain-containing protein n=1 Tax=Trieres chinensis TaxID=1514140 RepID=A0A7S2A5Z6_TRICV|mmetsp:Transcript_4561/g.9637  ORF Transcript_4561/g.9637 Transcript_4561/m.9637 type:complete len:482 (+) Transcript_4561:114-1559(+)
MTTTSARFAASSSRSATTTSVPPSAAAASRALVAATLLLLFAPPSPSLAAEEGEGLNSFGQPLYGVDVSFPIHHAELEPATTNPLGDRAAFYNDLLRGCRDHYGRRGGACDSTEDGRIAMALRQPRAMQNYTEMGFKKIRAPQAVFKLISEFWERNKDRASPEKWSVGNTYTNHWTSPTNFVSVEDSKLRGGGSVLKARIWEAARDTLQEWTGEELTPCSLYGIRIYEDGAVLATHVDRLPLVSSAIINVAQDLDEPWPIEVYGHDGKAYNVTMEPGDMVLYESHSVLHGRPFPLKGRFYANIFIHFEPVGHSLRHGVEPDHAHVDEKYRRASSAGHGGHENLAELPPYVMDNTEEANNWRRSHPKGWEKTDASGFSTGTSWAHKAAIEGDINVIKDLAETNKGDLHKKDKNGWQPIHEAARAGHKEIVELLVHHGANINERTNHGRGATPLRLVMMAHGEQHPLADFLKELGALDIGPDL